MTIRRQPKDFAVREELAPQAAHMGHAGPFAVYELTKESLTTPEAVGKLARALGVRAADCAYAGLKDKHALTVQHVSVRTPDARTLPAHAGEERWSAQRVGNTGHMLSARDIARNSFEIVVRDLTLHACIQMDERAMRLRRADTLLVTNYFGDQRFGSARHGEGFAARSLVRGEFEQALRLLIATPHRKDTGVQREFTRTLATRWGRVVGAGEWGALAAELPRCPQRKAVELLAARATRGVAAHDFRDAFAALPYALQELCVDAFQSWLWNGIVRETLRRSGTDTIAADDAFGEMAFAVGPGAERLAGAMLDLPGPGARYEGVWAQPASEVLQREACTPDTLAIPGLRRPAFSIAPRAVVIEAERFSMSEPSADELARQRGKNAPPRFKRSVRFSLPSGSYATVVLRALGQ